MRSAKNFKVFIHCDCNWENQSYDGFQFEHEELAFMVHKELGTSLLFCYVVTFKGFDAMRCNKLKMIPNDLIKKWRNYEMDKAAFIRMVDAHIKDKDLSDRVNEFYEDNGLRKG